MILHTILFILAVIGLMLLSQSNTWVHIQLKDTNQATTESKRQRVFSDTATVISYVGDIDAANEGK